MSKNYSFKSVAIGNGLRLLAADFGVSDADKNNFATFVQKAVRLDVEQNGIRHDVEVATKTGSTKTIKAGNKSGEWKNSGKGINQKLVYGGEREGVLLLKCRWLTRALIAQDAALAVLEAEGFGVEFSLKEDSETYEQLAKLATTFKPSNITAPTENVPAPATAT